MKELNEVHSETGGPFLLEGGIITQEFIDLCRTNRNGYTAKAVKILSDTKPPVHGWLKRAIGRKISVEQVAICLKDTNRRNQKNLGVKKPNKDRKKKEKPPKLTKKKNQQIPLEYRGDVNSQEFLFSYEWRQIRMVVLKRDGARCSCCGASPETGSVMHVDHIKPRRKFPRLALDPDNLQVLCEECNHGKGSWDETDWRIKTVDFHAPWGGLVGNKINKSSFLRKQQHFKAIQSTPLIISIT